MDFSEQDVDIFGEEYENEDDNNNNNNDNDHDRDAPASSSQSSSSSSSSSSSDSSSSNASDGGDSSSGGSGSASSAEEDDQENGGEVQQNAHRGSHGYEDRDLFGSDNEDYCKTLAISPFSVPGNSSWGNCLICIYDENIPIWCILLVFSVYATVLDLV